MDTKRVINKKRIILLTLSILCVTFIFTQSLMPANTSSKESGRVVDFLNAILDAIGVGVTLSGHFVRKLAHFTEFALLGASFYFTLNTFDIKRAKKLIFCVSAYSFVAVFDECLQLFSAGRACAVKDMVLDISGATFGLVISSILFSIFNNSKKKGKMS